MARVEIYPFTAAGTRRFRSNDIRETCDNIKEQWLQRSVNWKFFGKINFISAYKSSSLKR